MTRVRNSSITPGPSRRHLAKIIRNFLARTGMKPTPFGIFAAGDDKLLWRIENAPYGISLDKADRIMKYIEDYEAQLARIRAAGIPTVQERSAGVS